MLKVGNRNFLSFEKKDEYKLIDRVPSKLKTGN